MCFFDISFDRFLDMCCDVFLWYIYIFWCIIYICILYIFFLGVSLDSFWLLFTLVLTCFDTCWSIKRNISSQDGTWFCYSSSWIACTWKHCLYPCTLVPLWLHALPSLLGADFCLLCLLCLFDLCLGWLCQTCAFLEEKATSSSEAEVHT